MDLRSEALDSPVWRAWLVPDDAGHVALGGPGLPALEALLLRAGTDPRCRAFVLTSDGGEFCRGMDLRALNAAISEASPPTPGVGDDLALAAANAASSSSAAAIASFARCLGLLRALPAATLCVVEGPVSGGGVGLVAACDLVIASSAATFVLPELLFGLIPAVVLPVLAERVGPARARWLALSGETLDLDAALRVGLVDERSEDVVLTLAARLKRLLRASPAAVARLKLHAAEVAGLPLADALAAGVARTATDVHDPEVRAAVAGFLAGELPPWFARYRPGGHE